AASVGAEIFVRDVFLDSEPEPAAIRRQLALAERIAVETGYAIVICHPRRETLDIVGPWLTTAPLRGFELAKVSQLTDIRRNALMASMGMR
ncbi:MAG: divergent polysaccharide deacetylase family protein, partial [Parvularculaceae bacterium]|nr:divergent polysaccharide deacetylase family protein [Parvularculaceae bacterium]